MAGLGEVRRVLAREIEMGDWQASGFEPPTPTQGTVG